MGNQRIYKLKICTNSEKCIEKDELLSQKYYLRSIIDAFAEYKVEVNRKLIMRWQEVKSSISRNMVILSIYRIYVRVRAPGV